MPPLAEVEPTVETSRLSTVDTTDLVEPSRTARDGIPHPHRAGASGGGASPTRHLEGTPIVRVGTPADPVSR